jgi:protein-tyrosine phosphatase
MVWETTMDVAVIVMLTQTTEAGRDKCAMYYPPDMERDTLIVEDKDPFTDHAPATVKLLEINFDEEAHSMIRKLELTFEGKTKTVWHMLFTNWPDFGVPEGPDRDSLLKLLKLSAAKNPSPENPRIIHCSAGVGRSGTFIALDHLLRELDASALNDVPKGTDPVFDTVNMLREQRMMMVQSEIQFQFLYSILKDKFEAELELNGQTPTLNTALDGMSEEAAQRSPKVAKLAADIDSEISSANSVLLSEKPPIVTPVFPDGDGNLSKSINELGTPPPDTVDIKL